MFNPFTAYSITEDWAGHIARGSAGGIDWAVPVGTPIRATEAGYVTFIPYNGTGGHTATLIRDANHSTQFMHLSGFQGGPRNVAEGEVIGWSGGAAGADGAGSSTGPHVHAHSYDFGTRVPPFFLNSAAGIPGTSTPGTINQSKEDDMPACFRANSGPAAGIGISFAPGVIVTSRGPGDDAVFLSRAGQGSYHECNGDELNLIAHQYGIPWGIVAEAARAPGTMWTTAQGVDVRGLDVAALATAIAAQLPVGGGITPAQLNTALEAYRQKIADTTVDEFADRADGINDGK